MKVAFTFAGTVDVKDGTSLTDLREAVVTAVMDQIIMQSNQPEASLRTVLDSNLVEYDVINERVEPHTGDPIPNICSACGYARDKKGCLCK